MTMNDLEESTSNNIISRLPTHSSVKLGTLYNARADCIVGNLPIANDIKREPVIYDSVYCKIHSSKSIDILDLFDEIGIDSELLLSLVLGMTAAESVPSLVELPFLIDRYTRILHYYHVSEEISLTEHVDKFRSSTTETNLNPDATHIVVAIRSGIHIVAILQLSPDREDEVDSRLEILRQDLTENVLSLKTDKLTVFDQVIVTKVFSNIENPNQNITLMDLCNQIINMKALKHLHCPVQSFLRSIQYYYPMEMINAKVYTPFDEYHWLVAKQQLIPVWFKITQVDILINSKIKSSSRKCLKQQFSRIRREIYEVKRKYSTYIKQIRDLTYQYRNGEYTQQFLLSSLIIEAKSFLEKDIDKCYDEFQSLMKKAEFVEDLNQRNIKYISMERFSIKKNQDFNTIMTHIIKANTEYLVFCSSDNIKRCSEKKWNDAFNRWIKYRTDHISQTLMYADFSYEAAYVLANLKVFLVNSGSDNGSFLRSLNLSLPITIETSTKEQLKRKNSIDLLPTKAETRKKNEVYTSDQSNDPFQKSSVASYSYVSMSLNERSTEIQTVLNESQPENLVSKPEIIEQPKTTEFTNSLSSPLQSSINMKPHTKPTNTVENQNDLPKPRESVDPSTKEINKSSSEEPSQKANKWSPRTKLPPLPASSIKFHLSQDEEVNSARTLSSQSSLFSYGSSSENQPNNISHILSSRSNLPSRIYLEPIDN